VGGGEPTPLPRGGWGEEDLRGELKATGMHRGWWGFGIRMREDLKRELKENGPRGPREGFYLRGGQGREEEDLKRELKAW